MSANPYEDEVPVETAEDYERALNDHAHVPERVYVEDDLNRYYRCSKCLEPLYAVPAGVGEYVDA